MPRTLWFVCWLACACAHPHAPAPPGLPTSPAWRPVEAAAFAQARREHKLILLSVQAEFCHWCHVMNATTYTDARVVALLRERFVTLRVDEAERPDLAARYADWDERLARPERGRTGMDRTAISCARRAPPGTPT